MTTDDEGLKGVLGVEARVLVTPRPESLDISISIAISVWRLDIGNIRPRGRRLRPGIAAKVVLTVLFLAWETLVSKGLLAVPVFPVALARIVMAIGPRVAELRRPTLSGRVVVGWLIANGFFGGLQGLINNHG